MKRRFPHLQWVWAPPFAVYFLAAWQRYGPVVALLTTAIGGSVALYLNVRAGRRLERPSPPHVVARASTMTTGLSGIETDEKDPPAGGPDLG